MRSAGYKHCVHARYMRRTQQQLPALSTSRITGRGEDHFFHLVTAVGWTQAAGIFSVPIHLVFIPDVNDYYRVALTTGVNW